MTGALHQFVPILNPGAIATHILEAQRTIRDLGWESEVFAVNVDPEMKGRARHYREYGTGVRARSDDVLMYHIALGSKLATWLAGQRQRLLLDHHNITPPEFFRGWSAALERDADHGRRQIARLAPRATAGIADSSFNESELREAGCERTAVVPILLDLEALDVGADDQVLDRFVAQKSAGGSDWLFLGRVAPNKAQHDLVKAFAVYRRRYDPKARLRLVGGPSPAAYFDTVRRFADEIGFGDAVTLTGSVAPAEIAAAYRAADVFVCVSEHEGFLVPLLEAWHYRVPVVAFASTAVPETMGDAGVLLQDKSPDRVAAAAHAVLSDQSLRDALVARGVSRLEHFSLPQARARLVDALERLVPAG